MSWEEAMRARLGTRGAHWLVPDWPAAQRVRAFVTTRPGGVSEGEYGAMNLGLGSGDRPERVAANRSIVREVTGAEPRWLAQVHGDTVAAIDDLAPGAMPTADASFTARPGSVCTVLTADCLPVLLSDAAGTRVGVAHAGWRGMAAGVIENTVRAMRGEPREVLAWLGPAIGPDAFEVGPEVREAFVAADPRAAAAFRNHGEGKFLADLYALARQRLASAGVTRVHGGGHCTRSDAERFFSYRREKKSGRMGAFIWLAP